MTGTARCGPCWTGATRLLDEAEQTLLRRVSVFAAPFTADAAAEVAGFPPMARR